MTGRVTWVAGCVGACAGLRRPWAAHLPGRRIVVARGAVAVAHHPPRGAAAGARCRGERHADTLTGGGCAELAARRPRAGPRAAAASEAERLGGDDRECPG